MRARLAGLAPGPGNALEPGGTRPVAWQLVIFIRRQASGLVPYTYVKDTTSSGLVLDVGAKLCDWIQNLFPDPSRGTKK